MRQLRLVKCSNLLSHTANKRSKRSKCLVLCELKKLRKCQIDDANCVWAQSLSRVWLFETPETVAHQTLLSMGFFRQEYWSELLFPPGDLPDPRTEPTSSASPALAGRFLTTAPPGKPNASWKRPKRTDKNELKEAEEGIVIQLLIRANRYGPFSICQAQN